MQQHLPAYLSGISLKTSLSPAVDSAKDDAFIFDFPSDDSSLDAPSTTVMASCQFDLPPAKNQLSRQISSGGRPFN